MTSLIWSQSLQRNNLEERKAQIKKEIIINEKMLMTVKNKEKSVLSIYSLQKNKIKLQEKLIATSENQTKLLLNDIEENELKIQKAENDLKLLKADYAKKILQSHKSKSESNRLVFLLSSTSFIQAYKRIQYVKQYTNFRKLQGLEINKKSLALIEVNNVLVKQREDKEKLIEQNKEQRFTLLKDKAKQEKLVVLIKKDKKRIIADILKKEAESRRIDRIVDKLIRQAIAESNRKIAKERARVLAQNNAASKVRARQKAMAEAEAASTRANAVASSANSSPAIVSSKPAYVPTKVKPVEPDEKVQDEKPISVSSTKIELTPELKSAEIRFQSNKGKLIWPVENGFISDFFGKHKHDVVSSLQTENNGVNITTREGANARAVFDGVVYNILVLSPINNAIMIQHGDFVTVYQNLSSVFVKVGDIVSEKQNLGLVRTSGESSKTIIKFLVLKNTVYLNPSDWLLPK